MRFHLAVAGIVLAGSLALGGHQAEAHHNDWAAPLVGGALGGYALSSLVSASKQKTETVHEQVAPVYYAPTTTYVPVRSTTTIQAKLDELDRLAAGGYITPAEYKARREALLNQL